MCCGRAFCGATTECPCRTPVHAAHLDSTLNFAAFFIYIAVAPAFLVDLLHVSTWGFAWLFIADDHRNHRRRHASGRMAGRISPQRTIRFGYMFIAAGLSPTC
jgi:DHA1 family bicyclomycin/chloramphenicol resistance-like MFS transporter